MEIQKMDSLLFLYDNSLKRPDENRSGSHKTFFPGHEQLYRALTEIYKNVTDGTKNVPGGNANKRNQICIDDDYYVIIRYKDSFPSFSQVDADILSKQNASIFAIVKKDEQYYFPRPDKCQRESNNSTKQNSSDTGLLPWYQIKSNSSWNYPMPKNKEWYSLDACIAEMLRVISDEYTEYKNSNHAGRSSNE